MKVELIDHMGDDLRVVNAARVSFDKESEWEPYWCGSDCPCGDITGEWVEPQCKELKEGDKKLISYLARHNHWTPFSQCEVQLRETVPIFVARERFRHTVGFTYNEVSRRYVDTPPDFFHPTEWRMKSENKKQGSGGLFGEEESRFFDKDLEELHKYCLHSYKERILRGMAPEQARMVLPQSMYTSYYVKGSLAAFSRAYKLRAQPDAQKEIQEVAAQWNEIIRPLFPVSWEALVGTPS